MSIVIVIPAYQPTVRLVDLLTELRTLTGAPVLLVDDGSGPDFAGVFDRCRGVSGVEVVRNAVNLGKGSALKHGFNHALVAYPGAGRFVTADADGQHLPRDVVAVGEAGDPHTIVLGSRAFDKDVPLRSRIGNIVSRYVYRFVSGIGLSDTQTGLRSIPRRLAELCLSIRSNRYEFETEQLVVAKREGFSFREVPIETVYIDDNRGSHFSPLRDSFRIYFVLLRYAASSVATALVDLAVFAMLAGAGLDVIAANLGSRSVALLVQFYLLKSFVFKADGGPLRFLFFVLYVAATGFVSAAVQIQLAAATGIGTIAAKIGVETVLFILNFLFLRDLLFVRRRGRG